MTIVFFGTKTKRSDNIYCFRVITEIYFLKEIYADVIQKMTKAFFYYSFIPSFFAL